MSSCIRCGSESYNKHCCDKCLDDWSAMRTIAWEWAQKKIGKLSPKTLPALQKEMKRLDALWRKDRNAFAAAAVQQKEQKDANAI